MIGGDDMYMPLCRRCHARETKLNSDNVFVGDPSIISVEVEGKEPAKNETTNSTNENDSTYGSDKDKASPEGLEDKDLKTSEESMRSARAKLNTLHSTDRLFQSTE